MLCLKKYLWMNIYAVKPVFIYIKYLLVKPHYSGGFGFDDRFFFTYFPQLSHIIPVNYRDYTQSNSNLNIIASIWRSVRDTNIYMQSWCGICCCIIWLNRETVSYLNDLILDGVCFLSCIRLFELNRLVHGS